MTTLTELADRCQNAINDAGAGTWSQATIVDWCQDAISDYCTHFYRVDEQTINCVAGQKYYSLNMDFRAILSVEYPYGEIPPQYLVRHLMVKSTFWLRDIYYDVEVRNDQRNHDTLWISASPSAGEQILVTYTRSYQSVALAGGDTIEVPLEHEALLVLFVVWRAHQERMTTEAQFPDTTIRMLQQHKLAVQAAEYAYHQALRDAKKAQAVGGWVPPWKVDGYDRIY
jgi:hypothetical protein